MTRMRNIALNIGAFVVMPALAWALLYALTWLVPVWVVVALVAALLVWVGFFLDKEADDA